MDLPGRSTKVETLQFNLKDSTEKWPVPFCQESSSTMWGTRLKSRHSQKRRSTPSTRGARWWWLEGSQEVKGHGRRVVTHRNDVPHLLQGERDGGGWKAH